MAVGDRRLAAVFPLVNVPFGQKINHYLSFDKVIFCQKMSIFGAGFRYSLVPSRAQIRT